MLTSQINFLIQAVQDQKISKMEKGLPALWLLLLPLFRKSGGETVNASYIKKAVAKSG